MFYLQENVRNILSFNPDLMKSKFVELEIYNFYMLILEDLQVSFLLFDTLLITILFFGLFISTKIYYMQSS